MTGPELYESRQNHKGVTPTPWAELLPAWQVNWERQARLKTEAKERDDGRNYQRRARTTGEPWVVGCG